MRYAALLMCLVFLAGAPTSQPIGRVAMVLDASASMNGVFAQALGQTAKRIAQLEDGQGFVILIDASPIPKRFPAIGYATASDATRKSASAFLADDKVAAKGEGRISAIVATACAMRPDILWLASDGDFAQNQNNAALNRMIAAARENRVKINTWITLSDGPNTPSAKILAKLAEATGGVAAADDRKPANANPTTQGGKSIFD